MRQQINLYQPDFRIEQKLFSAPVVGAICGLVVLTYIALWGFGTWKVNRLAQEVQMLEATAQQQESTLTQVAEMRAQRARPAALEARVAQLNSELTKRTRALEVLRSGIAGQPQGFATRLEALARGHLEGVWLDRLVLTGAAGERGNLRLEGAAIDADLVPRYLQSLATENVLSGVRFAQFAIERPGEQSDEKPTVVPPSIRFRASSAALLETDPAQEGGG